MEYSRELNREITRIFPELLERAENIAGDDGPELLNQTLLTIKTDTLEEVAAKGTLLNYMARAMKLNYKSSKSRWHYEIRMPEKNVAKHEDAYLSEVMFNEEQDVIDEQFESDMLDHIESVMDKLNHFEKQVILMRYHKNYAIRTIRNKVGRSEQFIEATIDSIVQRIKDGE